MISQNAGLPNITGETYIHAYSAGSVGCFSISGSIKKAGTGNDGGSKGVVHKFNASWSNSLYGASSTVVPKSRKCKYFIKY